jgi:hypothetical protein
MPADVLFAPHHDAHVTGAGAPVRPGDLHVLVTRIDDEPAAIRALRRADDLTVFRTPRRLANLFCPGQRGSFEGPIRGERGGARRPWCLRRRGDGQRDGDERDRDAKNESLKH